MKEEQKQVRLTSAVEDWQVKRFLEQMEECSAQDFGSEFFYLRLNEIYEEACEDASFTGEFEWSNDYLFALIEDQIVGYTFISSNVEEFFKEESPQDWPHGCIWDIYVLPTYRHQGLAKQLVKEQLTRQWDELVEFKQGVRDIGSLRIGADALNEEAGAFFHELGFNLLSFKGNEEIWGLELEAPHLMS